MGKIAEKPVSNLFDKPEYAWIVAVILIVNGGVMFGADLPRLGRGLRTDPR